jgi:hypothetical protein
MLHSKQDTRCKKIFNIDYWKWEEKKYNFSNQDMQLQQLEQDSDYQLSASVLQCLKNIDPNRTMTVHINLQAVFI